MNANHSSPADHEAPAFVIKSPDTDVFIIGLGCAHQIRSPLLFHTGHGDSPHSTPKEDSKSTWITYGHMTDRTSSIYWVRLMQWVLWQRED